MKPGVFTQTEPLGLPHFPSAAILLQNLQERIVMRITTVFDIRELLRHLRQGESNRAIRDALGIV